MAIFMLALHCRPEKFASLLMGDRYLRLMSQNPLHVYDHHHIGSVPFSVNIIFADVCSDIYFKR